MSESPPEPGMRIVTLRDLYDADKRTCDPIIRATAERVPIVHPVSGVTYADGTAPGRRVW